LFRKDALEADDGNTQEREYEPVNRRCITERIAKKKKKKQTSLMILY